MCQNNCPNNSEYRIHRVGQEPKDVCSACKYAFTQIVNTPVTVQPLTLEGHLEDYRISTGARRMAYYSCSADVRLS